MLLKEAVEIGIDCGLSSPEEAVNFVLIHCMSLFGLDQIEKEVNQLETDAIQNGLKFCSCGMVKTGNICNCCAQLDANLRTK